VSAFRNDKSFSVYIALKNWQSYLSPRWSDKACCWAISLNTYWMCAWACLFGCFANGTHTECFISLQAGECRLPVHP